MVLSTANTLFELSEREEEKPILSLIIPTYNESKNISELVTKIENSLGSIGFELVVVDDNSPDQTAKIARKLNQKYGNIKVCERSGKLGLSSAVLHGFGHASGDILAVIDADMQHPPEILPKMFYEFSQGRDLVIASRYVNGGSIEKWKFSRKMYSKLGTLIAHALLPNSRKVKDCMSGCFMVRKDSLKNVSLTPVGFKILLEILSKCEFKNVKEVPYTFKNRLNGKSNLSNKEIHDYLVHVYQLFCCRLSLQRRNNRESVT